VGNKGPRSRTPKSGHSADRWRVSLDKDRQLCPRAAAGRTVKIHNGSPRLQSPSAPAAILEAQQQRFREKFGRDPGPNDPVFFDPDATDPVPMSAVKVQAETIEAMRKAGTPPQIIYAYKRTGGLLLREDMREHWPPDRVKEWDSTGPGPGSVVGATASVNETRWGVTVGTGVEYALFRNWSAKVEYDYMDFGTHNEKFHFTGPALPGGSLDLYSDDREQVHVVRFGLNYRFGGDRDFAPMK